MRLFLVRKGKLCNGGNVVVLDCGGAKRECAGLRNDGENGDAFAERGREDRAGKGGQRVREISPEVGEARRFETEKRVKRRRASAERGVRMEFEPVLFQVEACSSTL